MHSTDVLNLLHLSWNAFCMCSRFYVLWNLDTCRTYFRCSNLTDLEYLPNANIFNPLSCTNIILNPQRLGQSKITLYVFFIWNRYEKVFFMNTSGTFEMNSRRVRYVLRYLQCTCSIEIHFTFFWPQCLHCTFYTQISSRFLKSKVIYYIRKNTNVHMKIHDCALVLIS